MSLSRLVVVISEQTSRIRVAILVFPGITRGDCLEQLASRGLRFLRAARQNCKKQKVMSMSSESTKETSEHSQGIQLLVHVFSEKSTGLPGRGIEHETPEV
jgi:hypothetical protein